VPFEKHGKQIDIRGARAGRSRTSATVRAGTWVANGRAISWVPFSIPAFSVSSGSSVTPSLLHHLDQRVQAGGFHHCLRLGSTGPAGRNGMIAQTVTFFQ